jgi:hypothetical protein
MHRKDPNNAKMLSTMKKASTTENQNDDSHDDAKGGNIKRMNNENNTKN